MPNDSYVPIVDELTGLAVQAAQAYMNNTRVWRTMSEGPVRELNEALGRSDPLPHGGDWTLMLLVQALQDHAHLTAPESDVTACVGDLLQTIAEWDAFGLVPATALGDGDAEEGRRHVSGDVECIDYYIRYSSGDLSEAADWAATAYETIADKMGVWAADGWTDDEISVYVNVYRGRAAGLRAGVRPGGYFTDEQRNWAGIEVEAPEITEMLCDAGLLSWPDHLPRPDHTDRDRVEALAAQVAYDWAHGTQVLHTVGKGALRQLNDHFGRGRIQCRTSDGSLMLVAHAMQAHTLRRHDHSAFTACVGDLLHMLVEFDTSPLMPAIALGDGHKSRGMRAVRALTAELDAAVRSCDGDLSGPAELAAQICEQIADRLDVWREHGWDPSTVFMYRSAFHQRAAALREGVQRGGYFDAYLRSWSGYDEQPATY